MSRRTAIFDLDGTLLDSDQALVEPFVRLGVDRSAITFGHVVADECARLGIELDDYLDCYDTAAAQPYDGVAALIARLDRWAVCSNKHPRSGKAELARLGWRPEVAMFADAFDGPKELAPVMASMGLEPDDVYFVGDTDHDRSAAQDIGCPFVLAGWNPRTVSAPGDLVATTPADVLALSADL